MFGAGADKKHFLLWAVIAAAVILLLALIQILRVNHKPLESSVAEKYTPAGALIEDNVQIAARDFFSSRINLNRRAKLRGAFQTGNVKSLVSVLVMDEANFNNWKLDLDYNAVIQTGYVPGGKIGPMLDPGIYFLVIDNRRSEAARKVTAEFSLE